MIEPVKEGGSGSYALAGYEYQIDVSVWLALDLVLASKMSPELVLEPASEEDIEAELKECEPGRVISSVALTDYTLIVQAKLRSGDAWTVPGIMALLKHGSDKRESALKRLAAPNIRYLLITSAALNGGTRGLGVRRAGSWPEPTDMPTSIKNALSSAPGRVAILGTQDEERLVNGIERLLTENFRVPMARWRNCWHKLREEARLRISRAGSGRWKRAELEHVIRDHEGYIASSPELERYVHPTNWSDLRFAMHNRYAALIIGQSGTGKTMATSKLYEELRKEIPGLERVRITRGPLQLREDTTMPPVLYDIEDPWGRFDFDPDSRPWNDQLAGFFSRATHDRMIIATTRLDVAQSAGVLNSVKHWKISLEAEHYGNRERRNLYRTRIDILPREIQAATIQAEKTVLAELGTPLEIQKFFDALPTIDRQELKNQTGFILEAIRLAHQNSIELTVIEQIEERRDIRAAAIIWALLKANEKLSLSVLRIIENRLADKDASFCKGVSPLIGFFVAARNLRQNEDIITYYHPKVESGIEQALIRQNNVLLVRRTLGHLIDVLIDLDELGKTWGASTATRILAAVPRKSQLKPIPSSGTQAKVDLWLTAQFIECGKDFEATLNLAKAAGSSESNVSEVARYLLHRPDQSWPGFMLWKPPHHDEVWYNRMSSDPTIKPIIENFIREVLPKTNDDFPRSFVYELEKIAPHLSGAFLDAAARVVHFGVIHTEDAIAEGALTNLNGFEAIVDTAIKVLTPSEKERLEAQATHLAIVNKEYDEEYAEYLDNNDDGYTAWEFLKEYVKKVRSSVGWQPLMLHRHRDYLIRPWLLDLASDIKVSAPDKEEIAAAYASSKGTRHEDEFWFILFHAWAPSYLDTLIQRVIDGHPDADVRRAALICFVEHAPEQLAEISRRLISLDHKHRLVQLAIDLAYVRNPRSYYGEDHNSAATDALMLLPRQYIELSEANLALAEKTLPKLSTEALDLIKSIKNGSEDVRRFKVLLDNHLPIPIDNDVRWLMTNTNDVETAVVAVEAAIRRGMTADVDAALNHKFAEVTARALTAIAVSLTAPLPERLLSMARAKGSPIRLALVQLLDAKPHLEHLPTVLRLVKDSWSTSISQYGESDQFPIARAAVAVIAKNSKIGPSQIEQLYGVAIETSDLMLCQSIFELLARQEESIFREKLFELAINRGRLPLRNAAVHALFHAIEMVEPELIVKITPELLVKMAESVATALTLIFARHADMEAVLHVAKELATNQKRRVLLLLMIILTKSRDAAIAQELANMLPHNHLGVAWALDNEIDAPNDSIIEDLGDPLICAEVLHYMKN